MKLTNKLNLPKPFIDAVSREYQYQDKRYSVTTVIKGTKEILLSRSHSDEIEQDVADMIWLIFGTAIHKVLEDGLEDKDQLKETKISIEMPNGYTLSGQQDLYTESTQTVTDYKTGSVWRVMYGDWDEYRKQLLIYAYMFRRLGFPVKYGEDILILKDWSETKASVDPSYPQQSVHRQHFEFTKEDFNEIEKELISKFEEIEEMEKLKDDQIPQCEPKQRWSEPTKYALMKKNRKSAIKLYDTEEEAEMASESNMDTYVEVRQGIDKKCTRYCQCKNFCNYYKEHYEQKN